MRKNRPELGDIREQSYREVEREYYNHRTYFRFMIMLSLVLGAFLVFNAKMAMIRLSEPTIKESDYLIQNLTKDDEDKVAPIIVYFSNDDFGEDDQVIVNGDIRSGCVPTYKDKDQLIIVSCSENLRRGNMVQHLKSLGYKNIKTDSDVFSK